MASAKLIVAVLLSATQARGDFLSGLKLGDPSKIDPARIDTIKFDPAKAAAKVAANIQTVDLDKGLAHLDPEQLTESLSKSKAEKVMADAEHAASGIPDKGKDAASKVIIEDVPAVLSDVAGEKAVRDLEKGVTEVGKVVGGIPAGRSDKVVGVLLDATAKTAKDVNASSLQLSEFLGSFGPKASVVLNHAGEALACKLSEDCNPEDVVPLPAAVDPKDPQNWPFYSFMVLLLVVACGAAIGALRCFVFVGRKVTVSLWDGALVPMLEPSAREPTIQMPGKGYALVV